MSASYEGLAKVQQQVIDTADVKRHHYIPGTEIPENVAVHSYSVAMMSWYLHDLLGLNFDKAKMYEYALSHDAPESGEAQDVNTFASPMAKVIKEQQELRRRAEMREEIPAFPSLHKTIDAYEERGDEESLFVWTVDKIQALVHGRMDNWRPYIEYGVTYENFLAKYNELLAHCSPHLYDIFAALVEEGRLAYYDRPAADTASAS